MIKDIIIIGGGPSGLTAALYAGRGRLDALLIEKTFHGGQMITTNEVDNYPGVLETTGTDLANTMYEQVTRFGTEITFSEVIDLHLIGPIKKVVTTHQTYEAKTIIISTGATPRNLGLSNEENLRSRGVSYCAICDGGFYLDQVVAVVGGGDTAVEDALYLSRIAKKVYLIHRRDSLRANQTSQNQLFNTPNISVIWDSIITELHEDKKLTGITISNAKESTTTDLIIDGLFVAVGSTPATDLVKGQLNLDAEGYILTDEDCATSEPGVFAIGDVRHKALRQIITAAADGAIGIYSAEKYLMDNKN